MGEPGKRVIRPLNFVRRPRHAAFMRKRASLTRGARRLSARVEKLEKTRARLQRQVDTLSRRRNRLYTVAKLGKPVSWAVRGTRFVLRNIYGILYLIPVASGPAKAIKDAGDTVVRSTINAGKAVARPLSYGGRIDRREDRMGKIDISLRARAEKLEKLNSALERNTAALNALRAKMGLSSIEEAEQAKAARRASRGRRAQPEESAETGEAEE